MNRINVTKSFLPPIEEYKKYIDAIWASGQLTNQGPLLKKFEAQVKSDFGVDNFHFVANGTLALQLALQALDITEGEVITTPFSYVATTSSILWERCKPVFVDIEPENFCIDAEKIEAAITKDTKAIMPVHVFGRPANVKKIDAIAKRHDLKVIYDAAHAFGVNIDGQTILNHGDISICSFHATKPFHTIEGGGLVVRDQKVSDKVELIKRFGHNYDEHKMLGINAKASEFNAAMGLTNLKYLDEITDARRVQTELYNKLLPEKYVRPKLDKNVEYNYAYYPVVLDSEDQLRQVISVLEKDNIFPRRYFYPSLNELPYLKQGQHCPISEDLSRRILCLPLYHGLEEENVRKICKLILAAI